MCCGCELERVIQFLSNFPYLPCSVAKLVPLHITARGTKICWTVLTYHSLLCLHIFVCHQVLTCASASLSLSLSLCLSLLWHSYVTGYGKTLCMGFFLKIEFDAWLISSTTELTRVEVLGRSHASLWRYSALFAIAPHPQ